MNGTPFPKKRTKTGEVHETGWRNAQIRNNNTVKLLWCFFPGYCKGLSAGSYTLGFRVGNCAGYGYYDCYTGWKSGTHFIIEEVTPSPYD